MRASFFALVVMIVMIAASSCTAVTDAGRYEVRETLHVRLEDIGAAGSQRIAFWARDEAGAVVLGGILDGLAPSDAGQLDIPIGYALDLDGSYTVEAFPVGPIDILLPDIGGGPGWSVPVVDGEAVLAGPPSGTVDLPMMGPGTEGFVYRLMMFTTHVPNPDAGDPEGEPYVVELVDAVTSRPVGYYRRGEIRTAEFVAALPRVTAPGRLYTIESYVDVDHSGAFSGHPTDHSWTRRGTSGPMGVVEEFTHVGTFDDLLYIPED